MKLYALAGAVLALLALVAVYTVAIRRDEAAKWRPKLERAEKAWASWQAYGKAEKRAFDASEGLRITEAEAAVRSADDAQRRCTVRIAKARTSAASLRSMLDRPVVLDAQGLPGRSMFTAGELRGVIEGS